MNGYVQHLFRLLSPPAPPKAPAPPTAEEELRKIALTNSILEVAGRGSLPEQPIERQIREEADARFVKQQAEAEEQARASEMRRLRADIEAEKRRLATSEAAEDEVVRADLARAQEVSNVAQRVAENLGLTKKQIRRALRGKKAK
jgi:hypothetical protein